MWYNYCGDSMKKEKSCGCVVYKIIGEDIYFLIIKHLAGHYSFPKGHVESNESEHDTALREVKEETGFDISFTGDFRDVIIYSPDSNTLKDVVFFLGCVSGGALSIQEEEVSFADWFDYNSAFNIITYDEDRNVLKRAYNYIRENNL